MAVMSNISDFYKFNVPTEYKLGHLGIGDVPILEQIEDPSSSMSLRERAQTWYKRITHREPEQQSSSRPESSVRSREYVPADPDQTNAVFREVMYEELDGFQDLQSFPDPASEEAWKRSLPPTEYFRDSEETDLIYRDVKTKEPKIENGDMNAG
jgi:hypothetical protein